MSITGSPIQKKGKVSNAWSRLTGDRCELELSTESDGFLEIDHIVLNNSNPFRFFTM